MAKKESKPTEIKRTIEFEWEGTTYTMEFNRKSAEVLERKFDINVAEMITMGTVRLTDLPVLFSVAFMMHHPNMKQSTVDTLYTYMTDKQSLMAALIEMLATAVMDVFEEPEEGKAISWTRL